jgi:hypothetical protein
MATSSGCFRTNDSYCRTDESHTRDVSMTMGEAEIFEIDGLPRERGNGVRRHDEHGHEDRHAAG